MDTFAFTGVIFQEGESHTALCLDLDIASQGSTPGEAKQNLFEAVTLHMQSAFEAGLSFQRPIPPAEDPRNAYPENRLEIFPFKVDVIVRAYV
jgi:predicted RNase H-like HicB family nuclease